MIGRNKRGIRSMRVRLAIAAAVLVGGGAAGVVAVAASHGNAATAQSAGYSTNLGRTMSYTGAMSSAMSDWHRSPNTSIVTISHMTPMSTFTMMPWHTHTIALQRGTVVAATKNQLVLKSTNRTLELWYLNHGTKVLNVGDNPTGISAMSGGTMGLPSRMNMKAKGLAKGDTVFIFGERIKGKLVAQLVLFVAPAKAPVVTPTATTPTATTPAATPTATATTPAPVTPRATSTAPMFSGNNS
jgi:hypothetical protein